LTPVVHFSTNAYPKLCPQLAARIFMMKVRLEFEHSRSDG
jgi:hypothetical protein